MHMTMYNPEFKQFWKILITNSLAISGHWIERSVKNELYMLPGFAYHT